MTAIWLTCLLASGSIAADPLEEAVADVLSILALNRADVGISKAYLPDPDRLTTTTEILADPINAESRVRLLGGSVESATSHALLGIAGSLIDLDDADSSESFDIFTAVDRANRTISGLDSASGGLLRLVHPDSSHTPQELDSLVASGRKTPLSSLLRSAAELLRSAEMAEVPEAQRSFVTSAGRITIGTKGDDLYDSSHALILDPGGNDIYRGVAGVTGDSLRVSVVVDFKGNDRYEGRTAVGESGVGIVVDLEGDDVYDAETASQGVGIGGIGVLVDRAGDDRYTCGVGGQGFAVYGVGILMDSAGSDEYVADMLGQGAAGPGGSGLLMDRDGDDRYKAGGAYADFRENGRYTRSMSQGFSFGLQTAASGGVGALVDLGGDDNYEVSYFGQGAAHWAGVGMLYDRSGSDSYTARRYAQGTGAHLSAGILVDDSGDDVYSMWGVGQGCGHDLSVGLLADRSGNDEYTIEWLGQGVGSGNGTGLLFDRRGDDVYRATQNDTQGHGGVSREFGSIGLLIDLEGRDRYRLDDTRLLSRSGPYGARYDVPGDPAR